jgi:hypothetical protein
MHAAVGNFACLKKPEHGFTFVRWLPPEEREMLTKWNGDVFEIDCPQCGKYECRNTDLEVGSTYRA